MSLSAVTGLLVLTIFSVGAAAAVTQIKCKKWQDEIKSNSLFETKAAQDLDTVKKQRKGVEDALTKLTQDCGKPGKMACNSPNLQMMSAQIPALEGRHQKLIQDLALSKSRQEDLERELSNCKMTASMIEKLSAEKVTK